MSVTAYSVSLHIFDADEGVVLAGSWALYNGQKLYTEIFSLVTPGVYYLLNLVWNVVGVSYASAKIVAGIAIFMTAFGLWRTADRLSKTKLNYLVPVAFMIAFVGWPPLSYYTFNLALSVWAIYSFFGYIENGSKRHLLLSGVLCCLAFLFLWSRALVLLFAFFIHVIALNKNSPRRLVSALTILFAPVTAAIVWMAICWPWSDLANNLIIFPFVHYSAIVNAACLPIAIAFGAISAAAYILRANKDRRIWFVLTSAGILTLSAKTMPDHYHVLTALAPAIILIPSVSAEARKGMPVHEYLFPATFTVMAVCLFALTVMYGVRMQNSVVRPDDPVIDYVRKNCVQNKYLYAGPFIPNYYFEARKVNPTPFSWLITNHHTAEQFDLAADRISRFRPACAILNYETVLKYHYNSDNPVDSYIRKNYVLAGRFGNNSIYVIRE